MNGAAKRRLRPSGFHPLTLAHEAADAARLLRGYASGARKRLPPKKTKDVSRSREDVLAFRVPAKALAVATSTLAEGKVA